MPAPTAAVRDPWFDNAKMMLVTLVVVGHSWVLLPDTDVVGHFYDFLYAWHVPAFVFVTGYLSRGFVYSKVRMWQLFRTVVVPYLLFETALAIFRIYVGGEELDDLFRDPHWPMWYLAALFLWRLLTPILRPMWGGLAVAVGVSLVAGMYAGDTLDIARVLGLLPFFVMGLKATPERLEWLRKKPAQAAAVAVFVGIWVLTTWTDAWASTEWLYYRSRYDEMGYGDDVQALLTRALVLAIGTLGAWAFFALVPRIDGWFARMGAATLVVYLFHGFFVKGAGYAGFGGWADQHPVIAFGVTTVGAVLLSLLLAWRPISARLTELVDPLGYAERHLTRAVALTAAKDQVQPEVQAEIEAGVDAGRAHQTVR
ncbi:acyltransferase family protein [Nocardioides sp. LMS-CY]|uniref:acyltransferase family protein n=1 Tax=Nocardioides sp. (strain LMS-CY) TaxID=2840457 RepID=UPI001BFFE3A1|nr:acyltransferase family protein [Nocardioides sp. LMS-CY]QWF23699.1 acyltransferase family protein [Nocardioides sp. LMS-CY]